MRVSGRRPPLTQVDGTCTYVSGGRLSRVLMDGTLRTSSFAQVQRFACEGKGPPLAWVELCTQTFAYCSWGPVSNRLWPCSWLRPGGFGEPCPRALLLIVTISKSCTSFSKNVIGKELHGLNGSLIHGHPYLPKNLPLEASESILSLMNTPCNQIGNFYWLLNLNLKPYCTELSATSFGINTV